MCLAVPVRIIECDGVKATVDIDGVRREVVVAFIDNPQVGDYVLLHAGFAIVKWTQDDVREFEAIVNREPAPAEQDGGSRD